MLSLAIPVVVAEVGWVAMQIVDIAMVGQLGPASIGAVGVGSALFFASAVLGMGLLLGLDTVVAQAFGTGQIPDCQAWLRHGLLLALLLALPLTTAVLLGADHLGAWGFEPDRARPDPRLSSCGGLEHAAVAAFHRVTAVSASCRHRDTGHGCAGERERDQRAGQLAACLRSRGVSALGVEGAAWATCVSRVYLVAVLAVAVWRVQPSTARSRLEAARFRRLFRLGWPAAVRCCWRFGVFGAATVLAGRLEPQLLAAHQIVLNLAGLTFMVPLGVSAAGAVRVGHAVGAGDLAGARRAGWAALGIGAVFMGAAALTFVTVPRLILGRFTQDVDVIETGVLLLLVAAVFQLFDGLQGVATGVLRGLGDTRTPMLANLAGHWLVGFAGRIRPVFLVGMGRCRPLDRALDRFDPRRDCLGAGLAPTGQRVVA